MRSAAAPFNFGRALSGWWWLLGRDALRLIWIGLIWAGVSFALDALDYAMGLTQGFGLLSTTFFSEPVFLGTVYLWALADDPVGLGSSINTVSRRYLALLGVYVLSLFGMMIGLILLILPGLALAVLWSVSFPVLIAEQKGPVDALKTSFTYVKQHFWPVCGLVVIIYVSASMALVIISFALNLGSDTGAPGWGLAFNALTAVLLSILGVYLNVAIYRELMATDGHDLTAFD